MFTIRLENLASVSISSFDPVKVAYFTLSSNIRKYVRAFRKAPVSLFFLLSLSGCSSLSTLLFYPHQGHYMTPEKLGVEYSTIELETPDHETLINWVLHPAENAEPKARIFYLHGNGENISTHVNNVAWLTLQGFEVFLLDYRGYGYSSGTSTLRTAMTDIATAHDWLTQQNQTPIILFGQSMGGALAIAYSSTYADLPPLKQPFAALIAESAPANWPQVAREAMRQHWLTWVLQAPASLMPSAYDAESHITALNGTPILLMHSKNDPVVGYQHFEQLVEASEDLSPKVRTYRTNGGHTQGLAYPHARETFVEFVEAHIQSVKP